MVREAELGLGLFRKEARGLNAAPAEFPPDDDFARPVVPGPRKKSFPEKKKRGNRLFQIFSNHRNLLFGKNIQTPIYTPFSLWLVIHLTLTVTRPLLLIRFW